MTEFAATECQKYCGVINGPVNDVCEFGDHVALVASIRGSRSRSSEPLADIGDATPLYLEAVRKCPDAEPVYGRLGFKKRMQGCNAKLGEYSLVQYVMTE